MLQGPRAETQELDFFYFFGKHKSVQAEAQPLPFLVFQKSRNQLLIPLEGLCMWGGLSLSCPVFLLHSGPNNWGGQKLKAQYSRKTVTQRQQEIISERLLEQFCPHVWCDARKSQEQHETQTDLIKEYNFIIHEKLNYWRACMHISNLLSTLKYPEDPVRFIFMPIWSRIMHLPSILAVALTHLKQKAILHYT